MEGAPLEKWNTQDGKEVGRDLPAADVLGFPRLTHRTAAVAPRRKRQRGDLALAIEKVRVRKRPLVTARCAPVGLFVQRHEPVRGRIRQRVSSTPLSA